jgi:hypothetical protein
VVLVEADGVHPIDLFAVDLLARMALELGRREQRLVLREAPPALVALIAGCGLAGVLPCRPAPPGRQAGRRSGSPNIGKKRSVSRKNVMPAIRPSRSSST